MIVDNGIARFEVASEFRDWSGCFFRNARTGSAFTVSYLYRAPDSTPLEAAQERRTQVVNALPRLVPGAPAQETITSVRFLGADAVVFAFRVTVRERTRLAAIAFARASAEQNAEINYSRDAPSNASLDADLVPAEMRALLASAHLANEPAPRPAPDGYEHRMVGLFGFYVPVGFSTPRQFTFNDLARHFRIAVNIGPRRGLGAPAEWPGLFDTDARVTIVPSPAGTPGARERTSQVTVGDTPDAIVVRDAWVPIDGDTQVNLYASAPAASAHTLEPIWRAVVDSVRRS